MFEACTKQRLVALQRRDDGADEQSAEATMTQATAGEAGRLVRRLIGTWHYNWVSGVNQRDPVTGHWQPPTAFDITFVFGRDGRFEMRDFRQASSWCTLTSYETASGRYEADGQTISLHPARGHIISKSDCRQDWNYEGDTGGGEPGTIRWRWGRDALGDPALILAYPPGEENAYGPEPSGTATAPHGDKLDVLDRPSG
jgi:hypothetical protein